MGRSQLYDVARFGTKGLIEDYVAEISDSLCLLSDLEHEGITAGEKLQEYFEPSNLASQAQHDKKHWGALQKFQPEILPIQEIREMVERLVPDMTFQEALERTGRHINISIAPAETHQTSPLLNATTTPNVLIRQAIIASSAVPGVYPPVTLLARDKYGNKKEYMPSRKWVDGAVSDDLPAKRLARLYGVNHYIVSQTNPHIIPFIRDSQRRNSKMEVLNTATTRTMRVWLNASAEL